MKKKSAKLAATTFREAATEVGNFAAAAEDAGLGDQHLSWVYDQAVIRLYREFEHMVLHCLTCAINNDTTQVSQTTGVTFPKHLTDEVCEFLIVGDGYFDFKGRDGLIKTLKRFLKDDHYLVEIVRKPAYKDPLERLSALRNFAAHESSASKRAALRAIGQQKVGSAGSWLKRQGRLTRLVEQLRNLAHEIETKAPY